MIGALMVSGAVLMLIGNYERRIKALERNPRTQIKIVPRAEYDDQSGVRWTSDSHTNHAELT